MPREVWLEVRGLRLRTSQALTRRLLRHHSVTCSADVERIGDDNDVVGKRVDEPIERRIDGSVERDIDEAVRDVSMRSN